MRNLFIPPLQSEIILAEPWNFTLYPEDRNSSLVKEMFPAIEPERVYVPYGNYYFISKKGNEDLRRITNGESLSNFQDRNNALNDCRARREEFISSLEENVDIFKTINCTLEAGTKLVVDRIFIRRGSKDYDSVTFWIKKNNKRVARFWAKLDEVNQIKLED